MMFRNLKAEMSRYDINNCDLARILEVTPKTVSNKMSGTSEFTRGEMAKIKKRLFPHLTMDYLFDTD